MKQIRIVFAILLSFLILTDVGCSVPGGGGIPETTNETESWYYDSMPLPENDRGIVSVGIMPNGTELISYEPDGEMFYIDGVFIDEDHGWKMYSDPDGMSRYGILLYKTTDGGDNWTLIGDNTRSGSTLPTHGAPCITFINRSTGWIAPGFTPAEGILYLYTTNDGGISWEQQNILVVIAGVKLTP